MIITITVTADEVVASLRGITWENKPGMATSSMTYTKVAINNVKGACLHCLAEFTRIDDKIEFNVIGICRHCEKIIDPGRGSLCRACPPMPGMKKSEPTP